MQKKITAKYMEQNHVAVTSKMQDGYWTLILITYMAEKISSVKKLFLILYPQRRTKNGRY